MLSRTLRTTCFAAVFSVLGVCSGSLAAPARAQNAQFDLQGPTLEVKVQRDGKTLPISQVPNLQSGDRLWLHPVLGEHESVHYLMVAVFLRGSTNPPPDNWFNKVEAWNKQVMDEGTYLVVPPGAEQVVILFAPQTGGDFSTLKNAVRGRPGAFVRASQDLNIASLDRDRINRYLKTVNGINDPDKVKTVSTTLARSLSLKVNQDCFQRPSDQQAACLQQSQNALILDNGSSSTAQGLLTGPTSDLALQAGSTPGMAAGLYDPYIAAAFDIGKLLASFHTAQFQYIPALSSTTNLNMNLWLNAPPSFHNPKSVLVVALPPIEAAHLPDLRPVDPKQVFCMQHTPLVLPVDGAPAVFATEYGHGFTMHLQGKDGKAIDLPTSPDAAQGGFVLPAPVLQNAGLGSDVQATIKGFWGFDSYSGPSFKLRSTDAGKWTIADADKNALVIGRDDDIHLHSDAAACVEEVDFRDPSGKEVKAKFKQDGTDGIIATLPLKDTQAGTSTLSIKQYGLSDPRNLSVASFAEAGKYDSFTFHAGDRMGTLTGTRLDNVASLELEGYKFMPGKLGRNGNTDTLELTVPQSTASGTDKLAAAPARPGSPDTPGNSPSTLTAGTHSVANVTLKDGRVVPVPVTVDAPRPSVTLLNKTVQLAATPTPAPPITMKLGAPDELPLDGKLTFAIKSQSPAAFSKGESLEVATIDGLSSVTFSLASGELILQDATTAIATLDPGKSFNPSAFGPLHMRPILADGTYGDWVPLATLVRLPTLQSYTCPTDPTQSCTLSGNGLFLLEALATDAQFTKPITVPDGFSGTTMDVPRVNNGQLFAKLRDDPTVVNTMSVETTTHLASHHVRRPPAPTPADPATPAPDPGGTTPAPGATPASPAQPSAAASARPQKSAATP